MRLASIAFLLAGCLCQADNKGYLLVLSDGNRTLVELPIHDSPPLVTSGWATIDSPAAEAPSGQARRINVEVHYDTPAKVDGILSVLLDGDRKVALQQFAIAPAGKVSTEAGAPYGLPTLILTMVDESANCGYSAGQVKVSVPSVVVESTGRSERSCWISVRNLSAKGMMVLGIENPDHSGKVVNAFLSEVAHGRPLVRSGETYKIDTQETPPAVTLVVFEDGSYEGDPEAAQRVLEEKRGSCAFAQAAAARFRDLFNSARNDAELTASIDAYVKELPDAPDDCAEACRRGWDSMKDQIKLHREQGARVPARVFWPPVVQTLERIAGTSGMR